MKTSKKEDKQEKKKVKTKSFIVGTGTLIFWRWGSGYGRLALYIIYILYIPVILDDEIVIPGQCGRGDGLL